MKFKCTLIEQSKRLVELGIDLNTADMYYFLDPTPIGNIYHLHPIQVDIGIRSIPNYLEGDIPAWSLTALLGLIPNLILDKSKDDTWACSYFDKNNHFKNDIYSDNPLDATYEMVVWLLENKYI